MGKLTAKEFYFLLFIATVILESSVAQAPSFDSRFSKLDPGDDVIGNVEAVYTSESLEECVLRCSGAGKCKALQYNGTPPGNCVLIRDNSTSENGTFFMSDSSNIIYLKVYSSGSIPGPVGWPEPDGWTGPNAVLYWSFDTLDDDLVLMEETRQMYFDAFTDGKVNKALKLMGTRKQWVDLGVQTQACLVIPETCGPKGAAVAFWVYLRNCAYDIGIISSTMVWTTKKTGFRIYCVSNHNVRFYVTLTDSFLYRNVGKVQNQWIHLVMNYIGPMENEGFEVFQDGSLVQVQLGRGDYDGIPGNGSLVIGKRYVDEDNKYVSMDLDELVFFNRKLMAPEVMKIYNNENCSYYQSP